VYYRFDAMLDQLWRAIIDAAPYIAGACLALTLLVMLVERVRAGGASSAAAPLLAGAAAVHAPLSYAGYAAANAAAPAAGPSEPAAAQLIAGVYLVTVGDGGGTPHGIVLSSLCVLDGRPPSVLVCIERDDPRLEHLLASPTFAVHLLGREQHALAVNGTRDCFDLAGWRRRAGVPVNEDVAACLWCERTRVSRQGAHAIVVGTVAEVVAANEREPLVRLRGRTGWHVTDPALVASEAGVS